MIIFNVNYFHTTIVKNEQIINQPTNAFQSEFSLAALWRNENHAGVKDANPVAVNQETPKLSIALNGIVLTSNDETSFVLILMRGTNKSDTPSTKPLSQRRERLLEK